MLQSPISAFRFESLLKACRGNKITLILMNTDITNYSSLWRLQEKHHPGTIPSMHQPKLFSVEGITVRRQEKADK